MKQTPFTQRANDSTNLYILNLAFCDFLFCLVVAPLFMLHFVYKGWPLGKAVKMGPTKVVLARQKIFLEITAWRKRKQKVDWDGRF